MPTVEQAVSKVLTALGDHDPLTPEVVLVTIATGLRDVLGDMENEVRAQGMHPMSLPALDTRPRSSEEQAATLASVSALPEVADQGLRLLRWLVAADHELGAARRASLLSAGTPVEGLDHMHYRVLHHATLVRKAPTWAVHQGRSLAAYLRSCVLAPEAVGEIAIDVVVPQGRRWEGVRRTLEDDFRRGELRVLLWPGTVDPDFPAAAALSATPPPRYVSVRDPRAEEALADDLAKAVTTARKGSAAVLGLPELLISPSALNRLQDALAEDPGHPALTVAGLCHRPELEPPDGAATDQGLASVPTLDLNEAVLLAADGTELGRHRKLTAFTHRVTVDGADDLEYASGEHIRTGNRLTLHPTETGNLCAVICLDLLNTVTHGALRDSGATVLLVPSLSPKTSAHELRARALAADGLIATFVTNRWFSPPWPPRGRSFGLVAGQDLERHDYGTECLLYAVPYTQPSSALGIETVDKA